MGYQKQLRILEQLMDWSKSVQKELSHAGRDFERAFEEELDDDKEIEVLSIQNQLRILDLNLDQLILSTRFLIRQFNRD